MQVKARFRKNMLFGLENNDYANNCFMNVVVQNIWHLNGFVHVLKDVILETESLDPNSHDKIMYELAHLLRNIKESKEGTIHSAAALKQAVLGEMFGAGNFEWNE